jgi:hypothetical protein
MVERRVGGRFGCLFQGVLSRSLGNVLSFESDHVACSSYTRPHARLHDHLIFVLSSFHVMLVLILSGKQEVASGNRSENKAKPT